MDTNIYEYVILGRPSAMKLGKVVNQLEINQ
jgi:hypothetical protein